MIPQSRLNLAGLSIHSKSAPARILHFGPPKPPKAKLLKPKARAHKSKKITTLPGINPNHVASSTAGLNMSQARPPEEGVPEEGALGGFEGRGIDDRDGHDEENRRNQGS